MSSFEQVAAFYELDYPDTSDHEFLTEFVRAADPAHMLEIPCGWGRNVAVLLAAAGREVTFADIAETMVDQASRRIPGVERARARAVVADMRAVGQVGQVDLVICPREAFQLLRPSEAAQALRCLAASLTDDGLVVVDVFAFTRDRCWPPDSPPDYFSPLEEHDWVDDWTRTTADGTFSVNRRRRQRFTSAGVRFEMRYELRTAADRRPERIELEFDMTNHSPGQFGELARRSGLEVLAAFAGYEDALYAASASRSSLRTVYILGREFRQDGAERLERIREQIAAKRRIAESDRPDAS